MGERQRVALARAIANDPVLLLADEPTGNLDSENADKVLDLFDSLRRDRRLTLLVVTHSPEVADRADRVIRMKDGRVVEDRPWCRPQRGLTRSDSYFPGCLAHSAPHRADVHLDRDRQLGTEQVRAVKPAGRLGEDDVLLDEQRPAGSASFVILR